jgi:hypothetical protein
VSPVLFERLMVCLLSLPLEWAVVLITHGRRAQQRPHSSHGNPGACMLATSPLVSRTWTCKTSSTRSCTRSAHCVSPCASSVSLPEQARIHRQHIYIYIYVLSLLGLRLTCPQANLNTAPGDPVIAVQINLEKNFAFLEFRSSEEASSVRSPARCSDMVFWCQRISKKKKTEQCIFVSLTSLHLR